MDRQQAEQALAIIRGVIQNTRDDLAVYNWGAVWIAQAFVHFGSSAVGAWLQSRDAALLWYLAPLGAATVLDILLVLLLTERDRGASSFVERQLWGVWLTFFVFTVTAAGVLHFAGAPGELFAPLFAMNSGFAFAIKAIIFDRRFFVVAVWFLAAALLAASFPSVQWWIVGGVWWLASLIPGIILMREKRRLAESNQQGSKVL